MVWLSSLFSSLSGPASVHGIYVFFLLCHIPYVRHVLYSSLLVYIFFSLAFLVDDFLLLSVLLCFMPCLWIARALMCWTGVAKSTFVFLAIFLYI